MEIFFSSFQQTQINVEVGYFEEKSLNKNSHRSIYYSITLFKFFSLRFQQTQTFPPTILNILFF